MPSHMLFSQWIFFLLYFLQLSKHHQLRKALSISSDEIRSLSLCSHTTVQIHLSAGPVTVLELIYQPQYNMSPLKGRVFSFSEPSIKLQT